ncbi:glycerol-3-phosphate dehydrogenase [Planktotalea sp.]|uniref:glycerol-3-phosphate dehydrogenase n=1 Tax=Planktotalea sp. TaxID=2029877 RepID=UPI003D6BD9F8
MAQNVEYDLLIIGGGINGCGIARDATGRGLRVGLAEMNDLASATSSASSKLFHGGLRYLEYFEVGLVRKALIEREILLRAMPHISWPMRFVLPYHKDMRFESTTPTSRLLSVVMPWMKGRRPAWLIRLGLFLYDNLGGREILPATRSVDLRVDEAGRPLQERFEHAFEYSDCWVEDSRLVALNARDARQRGAQIMPRTKVVNAERFDDHWRVTLEDQASGETRDVSAKMIVNAAGPWVSEILKGPLQVNSRDGVRLVRGSHIVTRKLYDHEKCYILQGKDGRIIFTIPYEGDFTLIGTTDVPHPDASTLPECSPEERDYLCDFASGYFERPVTRDQIVWSYSGVRPLYDDGAVNPSALTRDYTLTLNAEGAPLLNVFGGKITTYRRLAEGALSKVTAHFEGLGGDWTAGVALPGGDFESDGFDALVDEICLSYSFLTRAWARRLVRAYGTDARNLLGSAKTAGDLGEDFGETLSEAELNWLKDHEFASTGEDVLWRRSKLGLRLSNEQAARVDAFMQG